MLKSMVMSPRNSSYRYIAIADLARSINVNYDTLYSYIRRNHYARYRLKTTGRTVYISSTDADTIIDDFTNAEDHAERIDD